MYNCIKYIYMKHIIVIFIVLLVSCTTNYTLSATELWAEGEAAKYPPEAQIAYLKCDFMWPNQECLERIWKKYGTPQIKDKSDEEAKNMAIAFIKAIQMAGVAQVLREHGYSCGKLSYLNDRMFSKAKYLNCDGVNYKVKYKGEWNIGIMQ